MFTLQILHTSDLEGGVDAIANAPNFATVVDALEQEAAALDVASITLSSGDNYIPGPFYNAGSDFGIAVTYEGFYNEFFGLVDRAPLDALAESADTNGDGFFDNGEIQAQIDAGTVTFEEVYTVDVNGDGAADYFEELDTFGGRVDIAIANAIGFDASAVGNHEFDASTAGFFSTINYESEEGNSLSGGRYGNVNFLQEVDNVGAQFPYLSANLDFSGDPSDLAEIATTDGLLTADSFASDLSGARVDPTDPTLTGPDGRDAKIAPSTIIEVEDPATMTVERVGVVGATTQLIAELTSNGGVVDTSGGVEDMAALAAVLQPFVNDLTAEGVDKIVLVSHLQQFSLEQELASLLTGVDVILAGGSDTISADDDDRLRTGDTADQPYPAFVTNAGGSQTAILSTDGEYSYVGRLVIEFDDAGNIIPGSIDPAVSGAFATDDQGVLDVTGAATVEEAIAASESGTQVKNLADTVSGIVAEIDGDIAGESAVFLNGIRDDVRTQETNFGNLTADANLLAAQTVEPTVTVSIKNGGGIRSQIGEITGEGERTITEANELSGKEAGEVSELDIDNTLRFDNDLVIVDLSTEDLKIILEHGVAASEPGDTPGQFPQVGGLHFSFDPSGTPQELDDEGNVVVEGTRVVNVSLTDANGVPTQLIIENGEVVPGAPESIQVVTLDFLAGDEGDLIGGDGYPWRALAPDGQVLETGIGEQQALSDFFRAFFPEDGPDAFNVEDTDQGLDGRIQILDSRGDTVLAPIATRTVGSSIAAEFDSGAGEGGSEIVAVENNVLFVTNGEDSRIDIFDLATESAFAPVDLEVAIPSFDGLNSVAIFEGLLAAAVERDGLPDIVVFFDATDPTDVSQIGFVEVGIGPDNITFTPDGTRLLVADEAEGEENAGSVSIIDTSAGVDAAPSLISSVGFTDPALFSEEALPEGVRVEVGTAETDFEPEFITVSPDGTTAFVALQENNAIAVLDIESGAFTGIFSTGIVDRSVEGQGFDPIEDSVIDITTFDDIVSLRQPDTIKATEINGDTFVLTANEGDGRDDPEFGDPLTVNELRVRDLLNVELEHDLIARGLIAEEPFAFDEEGDPDREPIGIEELEVSQFDGLDAHGRVELLHTYGSRSFTIWDAHGNVVFDSGDEFEKIIAERAPGRFNDDDGDSGEDRSNDAGPEPEALEVGVIGERTYAFIGLERDSGIMIYDITDPANAFFVNYIDPAFVGLTPEDEVARHSPEGIVFIPAEESTTGFAQIAVSYEFSGSTVVFDLPQLSLNEIRSDQGGPDNNEYIEIFGAAGTSLNGFSFVAIGDDPDAGAGGGVEAVVSLDGLTIGEDGFLLIAEDADAFGFPIEVDLETDLNLENDQNTTYFLVRNNTLAVGDDADLDDDGVFDGGFEVIDSIATIQSLDGGNLIYSPNTIGEDVPFAPGHIFRSTDGTGAWEIGGFDYPQDDTPGLSNAQTPVVASIPEIQGAGHVSPFAGQVVQTVGIVTAIGRDGFYIQDATGDGDDATSDAVFVYTGFQDGGESFPDDVMVGDEVMVTGSVFEIVPGGDGTGNLSTTQIVDNEVTVISSGNEIPETVLLGEGGRTIPTEVVISDDELPVNLQVDPGVFNPETDGIDFFESLEGMLVTVQDAQAVSPLNRFDEVQVVTDQGDGVTANGPDGGLSDRGALLPLFDADGLGDLNPERVQIAYDFDGPTAGLEVPEGINLGDVLGDITGVVDYSFGNFEVLVTESFEVEEASSITQETTALVTPDDGGSADNELTVATYNVLNVTAATDTGDSDDDDADQIALLAQQIVENLGTPDIVALQEIQDDSGVSDGADDGVLSADETLQALVDAIEAAGGPRYAFESAIVDEAGETGGVPGGNIRNAFLWNADRVEATNIQTLEVEELTALGVTDPTAFDGTRDPLLGTFEFNGEEVTLINNHLSSRFGSTPIFGGPQPFVQAGEDARELETTTLNEVVDALLAEDAGAKIVVLGDLNTFEDTDELTEDLPGVGDEQVLTNLITGALDDDEAYTFNFEGSSQVLDHIFVTDSLVNGAEADIVHVNVDFAEAASDHEPVVARLLIEAEEDGETLIGNVFRNTIEGTNGDDTIEGRFGRDTLLGNGGDDTISGGRGRDEIDGGAGDDMLEGGGGRDTFLFTGLFGNDTILDANLRRDRLAFEGAEEDDLTIEMVGEDVVITVDDFEIAGTVTLIAPSNFDEDNLFFV